MPVGYQRLPLPGGLPHDLETLIRNQLEPQLWDVHAMFRMPIADDPGLQGGCNLAVTQVLLSVVSGVSVTVHNLAALTLRGDRGSLFQEVLVQHYPWAEERHIAGARVNADAANDLWKLFRNPLAHTLGLIDPIDNPSGQHVVIEKGSFAEADIVTTEMATSRPLNWTNPTLRQDGAELVLWAMSLYWGVRRLICSVAITRTTQLGSIHVSSSPPLGWRST